MALVRTQLEQTRTLAISFGSSIYQIDVWLNDDGTYDFTKRYLNNGATKRIAENLSKLDAWLMYKELFE